MNKKREKSGSKMDDDPIEPEDLLSVIKVLSLSNNLANWQNVFPVKMLSRLFVQRWFDYPEWVSMVLRDHPEQFTLPHTLCSLITYIFEKPARVHNESLIRLFNELLVRCDKTKVNDYVTIRLENDKEQRETPLGFFIEYAMTCSLNIMNTRAPIISNQMLIPLLEAGADSSLVSNDIDTTILCAAFGTVAGDGALDSEPFAHLVIQLLRYSNETILPEKQHFDVNDLIYMCFLALEEEIDILQRVHSIAELPELIKKRMLDTTPVDDIATLEIVNPFRFPYANLLACVRRSCGFPTNVKNPEDMPITTYDIVEPYWKRLVYVVRSVNYMCTQGHLVRSIYYDQADHDDDRRQKKFKIGE